MVYRLSTSVSDTAKVMSSNMHTMRKDQNLYIRTITIALVGPTSIVLAAYNKYTCTLLIWFFFFFGMLEWSGIKRHIKVALLLGSDNSKCDKGREIVKKEYPVPVPRHNIVILIKTILLSILPVAACTGVETFLIFISLYFLCLGIFTLYGENGLEINNSIFKSIKRNSSPTNHDIGNYSLEEKNQITTLENFLLEEHKIISENKLVSLLLNFCLEFFGFFWIAGVTYPLFIYDYIDIGKPWILSTLVGNFAVDIVALLVGRSLNNKTHSLSPSISPKKSVEGAVMGAIASGVVFASILYFTCNSGNIISNFFVGLILGVMGVAGDLVQSLVKRTARVKDSGILMPGHGGVLDRIDGLLIVFPTMYCCFHATINFL